MIARTALVLYTRRVNARARAAFAEPANHQRLNERVQLKRNIELTNALFTTMWLQKLLTIGFLVFRLGLVRQLPLVDEVQKVVVEQSSIAIVVAHTLLHPILCVWASSPLRRKFRQYVLGPLKCNNKVAPPMATTTGAAAQGVRTQQNAATAYFNQLEHMFNT